MGLKTETAIVALLTILLAAGCEAELGGEDDAVPRGVGESLTALSTDSGHPTGDDSLNRRGAALKVEVEDGLSEAERTAIVDSVVPDAPVDLDRRPPWCASEVEDARGPLRMAGKLGGGLNVGNGIEAPSGGCLVGAAVRARWERSLPWEDAGHAGDGIVWDGSSSVYGAYIDNFADGLAPPKSPTTDRATTWRASNVYARYIRDDFIENDACLDGQLSDSLIDGTFAFISSRPGKRHQESMARYTGHVTVENALVFIQCQPGWGGENENCGPNKGAGQIFKWSSCGGPVSIKDTLIKIDDNMTRKFYWPEGRFENVWIVHPDKAAGKSFPVRGDLPDGVTVIADDEVWERARNKWMERHGCDPAGDRCSMTGD